MPLGYLLPRVFSKLNSNKNFITFFTKLKLHFIFYRFISKYDKL
jgi:hypothetical protein